jgi:hypothetical protein
MLRLISGPFACLLCRVEYFGLKLGGFHFTEHGWVQSYGSRYVRPPIIAGDVRCALRMLCALLAAQRLLRSAHWAGGRRHAAGQRWPHP